MNFRPSIASIVSSVHTFFSPSCLWMIFLIFSSSFMRLVLVWSLPAVSITRASKPPVLNRSHPWNMTEAGSWFSVPRTTGIDRLSPHELSCSDAAALKVSAATNNTFFFWLVSQSPSFPAKVVLPLPLIPTRR